MPVLFQLCQTSSFALPFSARYRHVALGLRGRWNCGVFAGEYGKGYRGQPQSQSEQRTKFNEPAFAEPPSSCNRGTTASRETVAGVCEAGGAFLFHYWNLGLCERILEESRRCRPRFARGGCSGFKKPQDAGNVVLAVGPNLVKLFQCRTVKLFAATLVARRASSVPLPKSVSHPNAT